MASGRATEPARGLRNVRVPRVATSPWAPVVGVFAAAAAFYIVMALRTPLPVLFPDEFRYAHLARSLADGDGFDWRGQHIAQTARLYIYALAPLWALFDSTVHAWQASKVLGALALSSQVFPVWWLARELVGPRLALAPAVLTVAGTWMLISAQTITEALALPLSTAALCVLAMALRRPGSRLPWVALGLLVLATLARIQMAALIPAVLATLALDVVRDPAHRARRLRAHRPVLLALGAGVAALVVVALAAPGVTGEYQDYFRWRPPLHLILGKTGLQLLELTAVAGLLPMLLAVAAAASPRAWRDDDAGPLLAVFWPVALVTALQTGFFLAGYTPAPWAIGRYVVYAVPIALILATVVVARPALLSRAALAVGGLAALALAARPDILMMGEERASWGLTYRLDDLFGLGAAAGLTLTALALLALVVLLRLRGTAPDRAALVAAAATGLVLLVQSQAAWWQMLDTGDSFRSTMAGDLEWVDHHASGPLALLAVTQNAPQFDDIDYFNRTVTQALVPQAGLAGRQIQGRRCTYEFTRDGTLSVGPGCGAVPHRFLVNDPSARIRFRDEIATATHPDVGRVVEVRGDRAPRARSLVILPCPRRTPGYSASTPAIVPDDAPITCSRELTGALWLDAPGEVLIRYRGGRRPETVTTGAGAPQPVAAGGISVVRVAVPKGYSQFAAQQSWSSSAGTPQVLSVTLVGADGRRTELSW
jgi:hypothetical protein